MSSSRRDAISNFPATLVLRSTSHVQPATRVFASCQNSIRTLIASRDDLAALRAKKRPGKQYRKVADGLSRQRGERVDDRDAGGAEQDRAATLRRSHRRKQNIRCDKATTGTSCLLSGRQTVSGWKRRVSEPRARAFRAPADCRPRFGSPFNGLGASPGCGTNDEPGSSRPFRRPRSTRSPEPRACARSRLTSESLTRRSAPSSGRTSKVRLSTGRSERSPQTPWVVGNKQLRNCRAYMRIHDSSRTIAQRTEQTRSCRPTKLRVGCSVVNRATTSPIARDIGLLAVMSEPVAMSAARG
jgi:hypothetical protein